MRMSYNEKRTAAARFFDSISQDDGFELWMKTSLHQDVSSFIMLNCTDGFVDKMLPNCFKTKFLGAGGQFGQVLTILKRGLSTFFINLDLFFDCGLLILLAVFHSAALEGLLLIVFCVMACLIILPMFLSYCRLFRNTTKRQKVLLFCGFPIFNYPAFVQQGNHSIGN